MKIVLAPDSFKGNLTSLQVASALEKGICRVIPDAECIKIPMADGGEGTVQSLMNVVGGRVIRKQVKDPAGKSVMARYGFLSDGVTAVIEMAAASGLPRVEGTKDKNPMKTTTYGTGQLILDAVSRGANHIIVGLGGSATIDGGAGAAQAMGVRFLDKDGRQLKGLVGGGMLDKISAIDMSGLDSRLSTVAITLASDVDNLLYGKKGSAYVFGPQKGATPEMVIKLNANLRHFAGIIRKNLNQNVARLKGGGAAGGLGAGLVVFTGADIKNGVDIVIEKTRLLEHIRDADLVITGEGRVDSQTTFGKAPAGVARIAKKNNVQTVIIGGCIADDARDIFAYGIDGLASACVRDMSLAEAMRHSRANLANAAERVMRLVLIGKKMA